MRKATLFILLLMGFATACGADKTPNAPDAGGLNLTGAWVGPIVVDNTEARMSWNLTQINQVVNGPVTVLLSNGIVLMNGFLTSTLSGMTLTYTISVGNGGVPSRPACAGQRRRPIPTRSFRRRSSTPSPRTTTRYRASRESRAPRSTSTRVICARGC